MNPIVFLWAHPRSMSTAIERIMRERGDFDCLHEPFLHYYYSQRSDRALPHFEAASEHPSSYAGTRDMILERAQKAPVFAKDMSYYVMPEILDDMEFCRRLRHCFLIRNPLRSILSYYRLDAEVPAYEIGFEAQWRQFDGLRELGIDDSLVVEAEAVQRDSAGLMRQWWQALGLDFRAQALSWERAEVPRDWEYVQGWHGSVSASRGIRPLAANDGGRARAEFDQVCLEAPQLRDYLALHQPFYERLRAFGLGRESAG